MTCLWRLMSPRYIRRRFQQRAMATAHTHAMARRWAVWMEIRRPAEWL